MKLPGSGLCLQRHVCTLVFVLYTVPYIITDAFITFEIRFHDQVEKLSSDKYYHLGLRQFQAGSIGAVTYLPDSNSLLVGARNCFYKIDLTHSFAEENAILKVHWPVKDDNFGACLMKGEGEWECQNFIQVIQFDYRNDQLVVCGTGAQDPICKTYTTYPELNETDEFDGEKKCPFDPTQQSTALFADGALYTATVGDYSGRDSLVYRSSVGQSDDVVELRSRESDAKWFNSPIFIESFEVDEWVLVFFREIAVEHVNSGDAIYARVGKVCKSDMGGAYVLEEKWTTYQKARLNCSFPGAYPFYFNYLQDVSMVVEGDQRMFYGVFSTGEHEIPGSAVCAFDMEAIREIFNEGQFKQQNSGNWYALPRDMEKDPRPGNCSLNSKHQTDDNLAFITTHPLMDQSVPSYGDPYPIFDLTRADYRLSQIAVYQQMDKLGVSYNILFLGTENGMVLKVVLIWDGLKYKSNLLEKIYITPRDRQEKVKDLKIITMSVDGNDTDVLMVVTNSTVVELPLHRCGNYSTSCSCTQDPFCVWNNISQECYGYDEGNDYDDQDVQNIRDCEEKELPVPTPTAAECLCETSSSVVPTEMHEATLIRTSSRPPSSSSVAPEVPSTKPVENTTTVLFTTFEPGPGKDVAVPTKTPPGKGNEDAGASVAIQSSTQQVLLIFLIVGWALFIICLPVIIFLIMSKRSNGNYETAAGDDNFMGSSSKQTSDGKNEGPHQHLNGHCTYPHLSLPASPQESSTDPPINSERQSPSLTPLKAATLERGERGTPQGAIRTQSLSRSKPPVPPKRTSSVLSHSGPRCPPPNGYVRSPRRESNPSTPTKMRQNSSSSSDSSSDREPPPYYTLSGSEDDRRRRPSGASNNGIQPEYSQDWYRSQLNSHEQSV